jgi:hypothetical protein
LRLKSSRSDRCVPHNHTAAPPLGAFETLAVGAASNMSRKTQQQNYKKCFEYETKAQHERPCLETNSAAMKWGSFKRSRGDARGGDELGAALRGNAAETALDAGGGVAFVCEAAASAGASCAASAPTLLSASPPPLKCDAEGPDSLPKSRLSASNNGKAAWKNLSKAPFTCAEGDATDNINKRRPRAAAADATCRLTLVRS